MPPDVSCAGIRSAPLARATRHFQKSHSVMPCGFCDFQQQNLYEHDPVEAGQNATAKKKLTCHAICRTCCVVVFRHFHKFFIDTR